MCYHKYNIMLYMEGHMARKKRVWYPGAEYHVMNRGNRRGDIFRSSQDYEIYLMLLAKAKKRYPFHLMGYCLMTNHVHLHIRTIDVELWLIVQYVHYHYSRYFNTTYNLIGHLFQGRYTAKLIEEDDYTLITSRYIHLNPAKAKITERAEDYPWSSYSGMIHLQENEIVRVEYDLILNYFQGERGKLYQQFVEDKKYQQQDIDIASEIDDEEVLCQP